MFGIYIHIPFCEKKCFYCDFYSIESTNLIDDFVDALIKEIELQFKNSFLREKKITSIFFGGGTPSLLSAQNLDKIFSELSKYCQLKENLEITLESNPGTLDIEKLIDYKKLGINRLSIGVQSFNDDELKFLKRIHNSQQAIDSFENARKAGFDNINLDIIFSIPEQNLDKINYTLSQIKSLNPEHISAYSLIYEPDTPLFKQYKSGKIKKIDDDLDTDIYLHICKELKKYGYEHYEVSNFAQQQKECKHNLTYWEGYNYIGFGPSAHSYFNKKRYWNVRNLSTYFEKINNNQSPIESSELINQEQQIEEKIMLSLRAKGLDLNDFKNKFGIDTAKKFNNVINDWIKLDYCIIYNGKLKLTDKGYFISNSLINSLVNSL